jgi:hypothetical protein
MAPCAIIAFMADEKLSRANSNPCEQESSGATAARPYAVDEYKEIGTNWRYWGEVRFKQMTVFLSASAALGVAALSNTITASDQLTPRMSLAALGAVVTLAFLSLDERATYYRRAFMSCAKALEDSTGFTQYQRTRNAWPVGSGPVYHFLFSASLAFWMGYGSYPKWKHCEWWALLLFLVGGGFFCGLSLVGRGYRTKADDAATSSTHR